METLKEEANWKQELLAWPGAYNSNVINNNQDIGEDAFFDAFIRQVMEFSPVIPSDDTSVEASVSPPPPSSSSSSSSSSLSKINSSQTESVTAREMKEEETKKKKIQKKIEVKKSLTAEPRVAFQMRSDTDIIDDGYKWRKYGQKPVKNSRHPRNYYRCNVKQCSVKKRIERSTTDPTLVVTTYQGIHNHYRRDQYTYVSNGWSREFHHQGNHYQVST